MSFLPVMTPVHGRLSAPVANITRLQSAQIGPGFGGTRAITYAGAVTVGSTLVACSFANGGGTATGVSDSVNGAWTELFHGLDASSRELSVWAFANTAAGTPTVTFTYSSSSNHTLVCAEYGHMLSTLTTVGSGSTVNSAGTAHTSGAVTTTGVSLLLGVMGHPGGTPVTAVASGFTLVQDQNAGPCVCLSDMGVGTTGEVVGTYTSTFTTAGSDTSINALVAVQAP